jgi:dehydrogenase/reductase SDR family member 12
MTPYLDRALDLAVLPGFSRFGFGLRGLSWEEAISGERLEGKVVLVTGGSSGIGEAACEGLAAAGARVHMVARDRERASRAIDRIESRLLAHPHAVESELCDLSEPTEIRRFAESFQARFDRVDLLVHNAGVLASERRYSSEGVELTFATNVLGPFLLTSLLLPSLLSASHSRVITVSSGGMYTARLRPDDLQLEDREFDGARFYAHTKRAQVVLNRMWGERISAERIAFHAMHPGWVDTPGLQASLPTFHRAMRPLLRDAHQGADTVVWLGTHPELEPATGAFWSDRAPRPEHRLPTTREKPEDRDRLWRECERLCTASEHSMTATPC